MAFNLDMGNNDQQDGGFFNQNDNSMSNPFEGNFQIPGQEPQQTQQSNYGGDQSGFGMQNQPSQGFASFGSNNVGGNNMGNMGTMSPMRPGPGGDGSVGANPMGMGGGDGLLEPPLLEELGIDFFQIKEKTMSVLNPFRDTPEQFISEADLAGPLVFCMMFGATMLASGRIQFGYIYGVSILGTFGMYSLLQLMSDHDITFSQVASILGYCLLPMVGLSATGIFFKLSTSYGGVLSLMCIGWCAFAASKLFSLGLRMHGQQLLIAYPCLLLYGVFAMLTVF